jgi:YggT family protein
MSFFLRVLNTVLTVYSLLLMIRILLTWFPGFNMGRPAEFLSRITDPYLNFFRRFRGLVIGRFDFSPVIAFIALGLAIQITSMAAAQGRITLSLILIYILLSVWSLLRVFIFLFFIVAAVRLVLYLFHVSSYLPMVAFMDRLLAPLNEMMRKLFFRRTFVTPLVHSLVLLLFLFVFFSLAVILVTLLHYLCSLLPF